MADLVLKLGIYSAFLSKDNFMQMPITNRHKRLTIYPLHISVAT